MKTQAAAIWIAFAALPFSGAAIAQSTDSTPHTTSTMAVPADNTKSNQQDPSNRVHTADEQKDDSADLTISQKIRQSVVADKSLSIYGHNAKIVSIHGHVTLNGVVRTQAEKMSIGQKAAQVAGADHVTNELKIEPAN